MNIAENNRLIAEFMDVEHTLRDSKTDIPFSVNLNYHISWDWIIPVLKKIETVSDIIPDNSNLIGDITMAQLDYDLTELNLAIVEFIKWYNKNK
jgi:hypothetical protein